MKTYSETAQIKYESVSYENMYGNSEVCILNFITFILCTITHRI